MENLENQNTESQNSIHLDKKENDFHSRIDMIELRETLNKVKTLAGFMKTNTGKTLVFSLLINNYGGSVDQVKSRMEQLLVPALKL